MDGIAWQQMARSVEFLSRGEKKILSKILSLCVWLEDESRMTQLFVRRRKTSSDLAFVISVNLHRWHLGGCQEDISQREPLGVSAHLLVACAGRMFLMVL